MQWPKEVGGIKIRYKLCSQGTRSLEEEKAMVKTVENVVIDSQGFLEMSEGKALVTVSQQSWWCLSERPEPGLAWGGGVNVPSRV